MLQYLPAYQPAAGQFAVMGVYTAILGIETALVLRHRSWGAAMWPAVAITLIASFFSYLTLSTQSALAPADWSYGTAGWIGVVLLLQRPLWQLVGFLSAHELIGIAHLVLWHADKIALLNAVSVSIDVMGFPLCVSVAATALRTVARRAEQAAALAEQVRSQEAVAAELHEKRSDRFADLNATAVPLLQALANRTADPHDPRVQRTCAIEAARMRRLFAEGDDVANPLLHALRHCADVAERKDVLVELDSRGEWPDPPVTIRRALTEAPLAVLATATTWARITVIGTPGLLSVNVVADTSPLDLRPAQTQAVTTKVVRDSGLTWVETQWATN
jgi:hypothetical protein